MSSSPHHRHHRKRRYRVPPEALGRGYDIYAPPQISSDTSAAVLGADSVSSDPAVVGAMSGKERARQSARRGMWICLGVFGALFFFLRFSWVFGLYTLLLRFWQNFLNVINSFHS